MKKKGKKKIQERPLQPADKPSPPGSRWGMSDTSPVTAGTHIFYLHTAAAHFKSRAFFALLVQTALHPPRPAVTPEPPLGPPDPNPPPPCNPQKNQAKETFCKRIRAGVARPPVVAADSWGGFGGGVGGWGGKAVRRDHGNAQRRPTCTRKGKKDLHSLKCLRCGGFAAL